MKTVELDFEYPESLIAIEPKHPSRVMLVQKDHPNEITFKQLLDLIPEGDVVVINETQVLKRRVFGHHDKMELEILFLKSLNSDFTEWEVLFPAKKVKLNAEIILPNGVIATLVQKGRPQVLKTSQSLNENYFITVGELPLPPYIQKARDQRHNKLTDSNNYQTVWAKKPGSLAAPTASLHFSENDIQVLISKGVQILKITLHVGLGTFLPVTADDLNQHIMHKEWVEIPEDVWKKIILAKKNNKKIWALGTTVIRSLESQSLGFFSLKPITHLDVESKKYSWQGETDLLIQPGFEFKVVDCIMTNFHQPKSTLLALVSAFSSLNNVKKCYSWAIEKKFRLFSYGDLSVWIK